MNNRIGKMIKVNKENHNNLFCKIQLQFNIHINLNRQTFKKDKKFSLILSIFLTSNQITRTFKMRLINRIKRG